MINTSRSHFVRDPRGLILNFLKAMSKTHQIILKCLCINYSFCCNDFINYMVYVSRFYHNHQKSTEKNEKCHIICLDYYGRVTFNAECLHKIN